MKKIRLNDVFNNIDNELLERAINTDNREKLDKLKVPYNNYLKWFSLSFAVISALVIGLKYFTNGNDVLDNKIIQTQDKYLSANYTVEMYKNAMLYVEENIDTQNMKIGDQIRIDSKELNITNNLCNGYIDITKFNYNVLEYSLETECKEGTTDSIDLTMRILTNTKQNGKNLQLFNKLEEVNNGYVGVITDITMYKSEEEDSFIENDIDHGIAYFDNSFNLKKINYATHYYGASISYVKDGYLQYGNDSPYSYITLFNNDGYVIWVKEYVENNLNEFAYEDDTNYVFINTNNEIIKIDKTDGTVNEVKDIIKNKHSDDVLKYKNNRFYTITKRNDKTILTIYNIKGEFITSIDVSDYNLQYWYDIRENKFLGLTKDNKYITILDTNGDTVLKIAQPKGLIKHIELQDSKFIMQYIKNDNEIEIIEYNFDGTNKELGEINIDGIIKLLDKTGFSNHYTIGVSNYYNDKIIENFYSKDNGGTNIFLIFKLRKE